MSNLKDHARYELERTGEEESTIEWYLSVIDAFEKFGHSGYSAACTSKVLGNLLRFENLKPLTNDPDEWFYHGNDLWQNKRNSKWFSKDSGRTASNVDTGEVITFENDKA